MPLYGRRRHDHSPDVLGRPTRPGSGAPDPGSASCWQRIDLRRIMARSESPGTSVSRRGSSSGDANCTVVWVRGDHDIVTKGSLAASVIRAAQLKDVDLLVDLSGVTVMDASSVAALIGSQPAALARTGARVSDTLSPSLEGPGPVRPYPSHPVLAHRSGRSRSPARYLARRGLDRSQTAAQEPGRIRHGGQDQSKCPPLLMAPSMMGVRPSKWPAEGHDRR